MEGQTRAYLIAPYGSPNICGTAAQPNSIRNPQGPLRRLMGSNCSLNGVKLCQVHSRSTLIGALTIATPDPSTRVDGFGAGAARTLGEIEGGAGP